MDQAGRSGRAHGRSASSIAISSILGLGAAASPAAAADVLAEGSLLFDPTSALVACAAATLAAVVCLVRDRRRVPVTTMATRLATLSGSPSAVVPEDLAGLPPDAVHAVFDNLREGVVMYDAAERLVLCNRRYAEIYRLPERLTRVGTPFATLLDHWSETGLLDGADNRRKRSAAAVATGPSRIELSLGDGRIIELNETPLPGGGWVTSHEDITERRRAEERALRLARRDGLTGLLNRPAFEAELTMRLAPLAAGRGAVEARPQAVILLDLDRFKKVNDHFGHAIGDALLVAAAARLVDRLGPDGRVARLAGDEFALLMDAGEADEVMRFAVDLGHEIARPYRFGQIAAEVGVSIGVALAPNHGIDTSTLLAHADRALRSAKEQGDRVEIYVPALDIEEERRRALIRDLARALAEGGLDLAFQPIVHTAGGAPQGAEALLRWTHPTLGRISPEVAISLAEESGLVHTLGEWILETALAAAAGWPSHIGVSVNLSALQFGSGDVVDMVTRALDRSGVAPHRLELELTETVLCEPEAAGTMEALRAIGVRFALDDFGTGYASLAYLMRFPFDRLKIDRSFVSGADARPQCRAILEAVAGLAASLHLQVVAEGVETEAEHALVRAAGCRFSQGWLFGRPVPAAEIAARFAAPARARIEAATPETRLTARAAP